MSRFACSSILHSSPYNSSPWHVEIQAASVPSFIGSAGRVRIGGRIGIGIRTAGAGGAAAIWTMGRWSCGAGTLRWPSEYTVTNSAPTANDAGTPTIAFCSGVIFSLASVRPASSLFPVPQLRRPCAGLLRSLILPGLVLHALGEFSSPRYADHQPIRLATYRSC